MLQKLRNRAQDEKGFTLIELLVVVLIIGILAAIALPAFLSQQKKAQDAAAKSNARNLVSQVESCFATEQKYGLCDSDTELGEGVAGQTGLDYGTAAGQVAVKTGATDTTYGVQAVSKATGQSFDINRNANGTFTRTCVVVGKGACPSTGATDW